MPNGNLQSLLDAQAQGRDSPAGFGATELTKIVYGIAFGMQQLHANGVVHRDLKPGNVFLDGRFEPRVADFGLSRFAPADAVMTGAIGSPLFMAPELCCEGARYSEKVDVFAFAVLVYHLFITDGRIVMDDDRPVTSHAQLMIRVIQGTRLKMTDAVPTPYQNLIVQCWAGDPQERPSFADILRRLEENNEFCFPGTDMANFEEYKARLAQSRATTERRASAPLKPQATEKRLTVKALAEQGDPLALAQISKSPAEPVQARRFNFTRSLGAAKP
jgi:serine/threonine protein kinase